jgi:hypothetical protein
MGNKQVYCSRPAKQWMKAFFKTFCFFHKETNPRIEMITARQRTLIIGTKIVLKKNPQKI